MTRHSKSSMEKIGTEHHRFKISAYPRHSTSCSCCK